MLHKLGPVKSGSYQLGVSKVSPLSGKHMVKTRLHMRNKYESKQSCAWQIFLKEELYQLLEGKRDRLLNIAAMTLQRYTRMFFIRRNFVKFRRRIMLFEVRSKGFVVR